MRIVTASVGPLALGVAMAAGTAVTLAQGPGAPVVIDPKHSTREQQAREATLRSAEVFIRPEVDSSAAKAAIAQVRKDFGRLQELRNEIARPLVARKPLDYAAISSKTAEVVKRATRLKSVILISDPPVAGSPVSDSDPVAEEHMSESLVVLCKTIDRFVENPVFGMSGVVDLHESEVAAVELLRIIDLGERIRLGAERARRGK